MFDIRLLKLKRKIEEAENNLKSLNKSIEESTNWSKTKILLDKKYKIYHIWYKRTNKLSRFFKIRVGMRSY